MDLTRNRPIVVCIVTVCMVLYLFFAYSMENDPRLIDPPLKRAVIKKPSGEASKQPRDLNHSKNTTKQEPKTPPNNAYDILNMPRIKFDKKYKNPCWFGNATNGPINDGRIHCLPYFFILGVKKSGTTDLYTRIAHHPEFVYPGFKESHWLTEIRFGAGLEKPSLKAVSTKDIRKLDKASVLFYTTMFDKATNRIKSEKSQVTKGPRFRKLTGDATPAYLYKHSMWHKMPGNRGRTEPKYTNFHYLKHLVPNAKIILIFRDPVSRLFSDFKHGLFLERGNMNNVNKVPLQQLFHNHTVTLIRTYQDCFRVYSMRQCVYNYTLSGNLRKQGVLPGESFRTGFYELFVRDVYQVFDRDHVLPLLMTDYMADMKNTLKKVFNFLEMRHLSSVEWDSVLNTKISNKGRAEVDMLPKTKLLLKDFYFPFNKQMADFMGDKRYLFK